METRASKELSLAFASAWYFLPHFYFFQKKFPIIQAFLKCVQVEH
jgi:hypothetical protein